MGVFYPAQNTFTVLAGQLQCRLLSLFKDAKERWSCSLLKNLLLKRGNVWCMYGVENENHILWSVIHGSYVLVSIASWRSFLKTIFASCSDIIGYWFASKQPILLLIFMTNRCGPTVDLNNTIKEQFYIYSLLKLFNILFLCIGWIRLIKSKRLAWEYNDLSTLLLAARDVSATAVFAG